MYSKNPRSSRHSSIRLPVFFLMLCAAGIFACSRVGGDDFVQTSLRHLAQDHDFLRTSLVLETGMYPTEQEILPASTMDTASPNEDVPESNYAPTATDAAKSQPITETTSRSNGTVKINNNTDFTYDIPAMLQSPVNIAANTSGPQVFLIHTHSTEAYTQDSENTYKCSEPIESERTLDATKNVIRVGDEMQKILESRGISVIHCREVFDNPAYNGCYGRALSAIEAQLKKTPSIQVIIDVHRDSIVNDSGQTFKTSCTIDDQNMAQLMLVIGSNGSGLTHDNWRNNLNYAVNLQNRVTAKYPNLMRPLNLRPQRFNEHMRTGSMLLEVGSSGNTLPEAINAAKLFADILADDLLNE